MDTISHIIDETAIIAGELSRRGWAEANAGNISVNVNIIDDSPSVFKVTTTVKPLAGLNLDKELKVLITAAGSRMREIMRDPLKYMGVLSLKPGNEESTFNTAPGIQDIRPTSELPTHAMIHKFLVTSKPAYRAVVHCHATDLISISHSPELKDEARLTDLLFSIHPETIIALPDGVGLIDYHITGSEKLAHATLESLANHDLVIWPYHGCIAVAPDVSRAFDRIDIANKAASIYLSCKQAGYNPEGLSGEQLRELKQKFGS